MSVPEAVAQVTEALKAEGFGVLTTIDVQATLKDKLGVEQEPYIILGACNPRLSHRALMADPHVGLLLPCNVVVRALPEATREPRARVEAVNPVAMMSVVRQPDLLTVAHEARARLERVIADLA
jgi:uncharacterized protein (DUF302 family)